MVYYQLTRLTILRGSVISQVSRASSYLATTTPGRNFRRNVGVPRLQMATRLNCQLIIPLQGFCSQANRNVDLSFDDLQSLIKSRNIQLIDVREPKELVEYGVYPSAINIPFADLQNAFKLSGDQFSKKYGIKKPQLNDTNIVFACLKGIRSRKAIDTIAELGYRNAKHYTKGWEEYSEKMGLPLKKNPSS